MKLMKQTAFFLPRDATQNAVMLRQTRKLCYLLQRWPRDARYISRSWAVAEIWSFAYVGGIWNPHLGGRGLGEVVEDQRWHH